MQISYDFPMTVRMLLVHMFSCLQKVTVARENDCISQLTHLTLALYYLEYVVCYLVESYEQKQANKTKETHWLLSHTLLRRN